MIVQDILDLVKFKFANVALAENNDAIIKIIYLGVSELYRKFNLSIKSETIRITPDLSLYELKNKDVALFLSLYDRTGKELKQSDVVNSVEWDYKIVNYRSFILHKPKEELLYALYKASPIVFRDSRDEIDIPDAMIDALLCYIGYMIHSTITSYTSINGRSGTSESDLYYQKFLTLCNDLEMQGFKIPLNSESLSVIVKGYI